MGYSYYFYVETRRTGEWTSPDGFENEQYHYKRLGCFTWMSGRSNRREIFFGSKAIFPFRREVPPDRNRSALFQYLDTFYDYQYDEMRLSWIPHTELLIDLWDEMDLIITNKIAAKHAATFGDGRQLFPYDKLLSAGWKDYEIDNFRDGKIIAQTIDYEFGKFRNRLATSSPEMHLDVTWKDSITGYLGGEKKEQFLNLRRFGSDEQLRIISCYA